MEHKNDAYENHLQNETASALNNLFNDNFCQHLLRFMIKEHMTSSDFEKRGQAFFKKIKEWECRYLSERKTIDLYGIKGWHFKLTETKFLIDFNFKAPEQIQNCALIMFLTCIFGKLDDYDYSHCMRIYNDAFFQKYYPDFDALFHEINHQITDFEKNICDDLQYEFTQNCVTQLSTETFIQELEQYGQTSYSRFEYYRHSPEQSIDHEFVAKLEIEYPRYTDFISTLKNDCEILQAYKVNEHNCDTMTLYLAFRNDGVLFLSIEDYM